MLEELLGVRFPAVAVSATTGQGLERLGPILFQGLGVIRVYTKAPGKDPDTDAPFTLFRGETVADLALQVHREIAESLKFARVWGEWPVRRAAGRIRSPARGQGHRRASCPQPWSVSPAEGAGEVASMIRIVLSLGLFGCVFLGACGSSVETAPRSFPGQSDDVRTPDSSPSIRTASRMRSPTSNEPSTRSPRMPTPGRGWRRRTGARSGTKTP